MANILIDEKTIEENGQTYLIKTYKTKHGTTVVKELVSEIVVPDEPQIEPFDNETALLELLSMTEYNTCLLEMQMEM
jgi:hypothetical protein